MKHIFNPKTSLEKFGFKVCNALVENFPRTYFVGGAVRDFLSGKKIKDIDIATSARPEEVVETLKKYFIGANLGFQKLGVIIAAQNHNTTAITTFRKDLKSRNRYPKIRFVKTPKEDSQRRDFTINALYLSPKTGKILDFFKGLKDLQNKQIRFIGEAKKRIKEDPLRIIRALRFALKLDFKLENQTKRAIKEHFLLVKQLTKNKIKKEIEKLNKKFQRDIIEFILDNPENLDKYF